LGNPVKGLESGGSKAEFQRGDPTSEQMKLRGLLCWGSAAGLGGPVLAPVTQSPTPSAQTQPQPHFFVAG